MSLEKTTIVACATGKVRAGISIIRLSGGSAAEIAEKICHRPCPTPRLVTNRNFYTQAGELLDKGLVVFFVAPHSFTGEDLVELHCHGSPYIVDAIIQEAITLGAHMAKPARGPLSMVRLTWFKQRPYVI